MKRIESFAALLLPGSSVLPRFGVSILALILVLFLTPTRAQDSHFLFDANGDLLVQTAAISALPQILGQPQNQVVAPGDSASFFIVAADTRNLAYQWRFNGTDIGGANADALLLQNVGTNNQGQYSVVLVNSSGSVTSTPAALMLDTRDSGMPDSWQMTYFGNLTNTATGDYDHDGISNLQEFLDGTNPTNSASARYRLRVLGNGGSVEAIPLRLGYTNGEQVTLTATAFAPDSFRGWAGDINNTNNPVTLTMTNNKTVFAYLGPLDIFWTNNYGGDWNVAANWSPNVVPGYGDNVFITGAVTVTLNTDTDCASLTLGSTGFFPTLSGSGTLTLRGSSTWVGGTMSGSGRTVILPGATLYVASAFTLSLTSRTLENGGTMLWTGAGIYLTSAIITNRAGALFVDQNNASFNYQGGTERFDNAGIFRKSVNSGTTTFGCAFNNYGGVDLQTGTMALLRGGSNSGTISVPAGTTLNLSGTFTSGGASSIMGDGNLTVSGGPGTLAGLVNLGGTNLFSGGTVNLTGTYICTNNTLTISGGTAIFDGSGTVSPSVVNLDNLGTLGGADLVTVGSLMNWGGGATMSGTGRTVIAPGATLTISNPFTVSLTSRTLENCGSVLTEVGFYLTGAVITNRAGALFQVRNDISFSSSGGTCRFDNAGIFRKSAGTGTTILYSGIPFNNYGTVDLRTGILAANGGYNSTSGSLLNCALGGTSPGTGYAQLQVAGTVTLNGALSVGLTNGYVPSTSDAFTVLTAGTRNGNFANFYYPSNVVTMQLSNTVNSVIVRVTAVTPPPPLLLPPQLSGSNFTIIWTAISNTTYRVEFNPNLNPSNWTNLPGDVTALSNTASKLDPLTPSNRLYRVRVVP